MANRVGPAALCLHWFLGHVCPIYIGRQRAILTISTPWANTADDKVILFLTYHKNRVWHFLQMETICLKHLIIFSGKIKRNISNCNFFPACEVLKHSKIMRSTSLSVCPPLVSCQCLCYRRWFALIVNSNFLEKKKKSKQYPLTVCWFCW